MLFSPINTSASSVLGKVSPRIVTVYPCPAEAATLSRLLDGDTAHLNEWQRHIAVQGKLKHGRFYFCFQPSIFPQHLPLLIRAIPEIRGRMPLVFQ